MPVAASNLSPAGPEVADATLAQLALGEQLVVWAFRKRLEGESRATTVQRGFELAGSGPARHDALAAFEALFALIAGHCRRDLWFHRCGCCRISPDEMAILGLIAAQQAGDMASALCSGQSLVAAPVVGEALRLAGRLGRTLAELGLALPLRCSYAPRSPDTGATRHH
jgi:hypothetical protein